MRAAEANRRASRIRDGEGLVLDERRVLSLVGDVVPLDATICHLRVKVRCVAQRRDGVHAADCAVGRVLPRVDGMVFLRNGRGIGVFPPELDVVLLVGHHGVRGRAFAPAVAADAGVGVETLPALDGNPDVLAVVPGVLLEGGLVDGVPDVHAEALFEWLCIRLA